MFIFFSCSIDVTKCDTVFLQESKSLYVVVLLTHTIIVFLMFVALKWVKNVFRNTKIKFDLIWTSILREIDGDWTSVCRKNIYCVHKYNSGNLRVPCD